MMTMMTMEMYYYMTMVISAVIITMTDNHRNKIQHDTRFKGCNRKTCSTDKNEKQWGLVTRTAGGGGGGGGGG